MTRDAIAPTRGTAQIGRCDPHETFSHDAFGVMTLVETTGADPTLFGSDIAHDRQLTLTISRATMLRNLSRDSIHGGRRELIEISMSHAQFAQFITSQGKGDGVPVTIRQFNGEDMPAIKNLESKAETIQREILESSQRELAALNEMVERFGEMVNSGKLGVKEARELHRSMKIASENMPRNMEYVVEQGRRSIVRAQNAAMMELEAYGEGVARRLVVESLAQLSEFDPENTSQASLPRSRERG